MAVNLGALVAACAAAAPGDLAYADAERAITYEELEAATAGLAAGLSGAGVRPGDAVALVMDAGVELCEVFWAVQRAGAVPCVLNPNAPEAAIDRRARAVGCRLVVRAGSVAGLRRPCGPAPAAEPGPEDVAHLQVTSGTSGEPRAAMITNRNLLAYLAAAREAYGTTPEDVLVSWIPPWHDMGLVHFVLRALYDRIPCHIVEPSVRTIPRWLETVGAVGGTLTDAPDFALRAATRLVDPGRVDLRTLRVLSDGGEPVRATTIDAFEERFGVPGLVAPGYGLAEATLGVTVQRPGERRRVDAKGHVGCGTAFPGVEVRAGACAEEPGEILVRGETVFAGYRDDPESTAAALRDGWLHTGDLGYLDEDGVLFVLGRTRAIIKRGGALIAPRELEEAALQVPEVRVAAAVGLAAEGAATEQICVAVEVGGPEQDSSESVAARVNAEIRRGLGFGAERVLVVPPRTIPRTLNGKVQHARLRERLQAEDLP
jgi:fatty-acyl-CoA synthase